MTISPGPAAAVVRCLVPSLESILPVAFGSPMARLLLTLVILLWASASALADDAPSARGVVVALNRAELATHLTAPVAVIGFREGEAFSRGDLLIGFDCRRQQSELASATAKVREARLTLESNRYLVARNALGRHEAEIAAAKLAQAQADAAAIEARLTNCEVRAPFSGLVASLAINRHEYPKPGAPFLTILSNDHLEIELIVPSRWLRWLKTGHAFRFKVEELGTSAAGRIVRIGGAVDPVSQTIKLYGRADSTHAGLRAGMSGTAELEALQSGPVARAPVDTR